MFVRIENAALLVRLVEQVGLPEVTARHDDEMFGPYSFEGRPTFLRYRVSEDAWDALADEAVPDDDDDRLITDEEVEAVFIRCLERGPTPPLPSDMGARTEDEQFIFVGARFQWIFFPELKRWELAALGRA